MPALGGGVHKGQRGLALLGTNPSHPFDFQWCSGIAGKHPFHGSPTAAQGGRCCVQPPATTSRPLQHRVELGSGQENRGSRDLGALESGQMGSGRSSSQGLRVQTESLSPGEDAGPPPNVLTSVCSHRLAALGAFCLHSPTQRLLRQKNPSHGPQ